ncbi:MAG: alpha/beta fold hydrolase [Thermoanaerobaculales bacterium]|nr:alpha/beta fold hydrolase [Thermoanaerobaculales bacterium]
MQEIPEHLYPFNRNWLDLDGLRLHYLDEGEGETVVAVHGNPTWSFYYRDLVRDLRKDHRVVVPDHMGCGLSDKPGDDRYDYTLSRRIDDFGRVMDELDLTDINLVVHDWGGMIGLGWAVRHPDRIKRLVVLNTAAFHLPKSKPFPWQLWMVRDTPLGPLVVRAFNAFSRGASHVACTRKKLSNEIRDAYCAPYDNWNDRIATLRFVQDIPLKPGDRGYDIVSDTAARLDVFQDRPVLVCWGDKDFVFDRHFLEEWQRIYPDAEIHRYPDCGHYILEDASEEVIPLIRRFLTDAV